MFNRSAHSTTFEEIAVTDAAVEEASEEAANRRMRTATSSELRAWKEPRPVEEVASEMTALAKALRESLRDG